MKAKYMVFMAVLAAFALTVGGESFASGGIRGDGAGLGFQASVRSQNSAMNQTAPRFTNQVRPEGSQRRDGSFLSTGTTANGSTQRPASGRGLMDGTGINHPKGTTP